MPPSGAAGDAPADRSEHNGQQDVQEVGEGRKEGRSSARKAAPKPQPAKPSSSSQAATRRSRRATATPPCRPTSRPCRAGNATSGAASTRSSCAPSPACARRSNGTRPSMASRTRVWFLGFHCFTKYIKVTFFRGTSLRPVPPGASKHKDVRYLDIHEDEARRSSVRRLGEAGQPIARRTNVSGHRGSAMNDLLRFPSAVRRDPRIEAWFSDFADPLRLMTRTWFERMRDCGADVRELLHDGCPVAAWGTRRLDMSTRSRLMRMSASSMAQCSRIPPACSKARASACVM